jgi:hypothetical protein
VILYGASTGEVLVSSTVSIVGGLFSARWRLWRRECLAEPHGPDARRLRRALRWAALVLAVVVSIQGCFRYRPVALTQLDAGQIPVGTVLRIVFRDEKQRPVLLALERVDLPFVAGTVNLGQTPGERVLVRRRYDLRAATSIEIQEYDGRTTAIVAIVPVALFVGLMMVVLLTKESCPLVYVDRGSGFELVGEAYAGAAFRAIQREDLLPIPGVEPAGHVELELANRAHETQYTDLARLVVVDHAPASRVLSSSDARLLSVGASRAPEAATELEGRQVAAALAAADGALWESDMPAFAAAADPPRTDGVVARFEAPPGDGPLVLELVAANTPLLDVTFGRFFASMGERLEEYLAQGNDPAARERLGSWRVREGVDLSVELLDAGKWRSVGVVPTVGPMALREVAVELPPRAAGEVVDVRVRGGTGFWRIDRLGLSRADGAAFRVEEVALARPASAGTEDVRGLLEAVDGRYQVLAERGDGIRLGFEAPSRIGGLARSTFFRSSGYYNVHRPFRGAYVPGNLLVAAREEGGLARFALDLYRDYRERLQAPARGSAAELEAP